MSYPENLPEISIDPQRASLNEIAKMAADLMDFRRNRQSFIEWLETQIKRYRLVGEPEPNWNTIYDKAKEML